LYGMVQFILNIKSLQFNYKTFKEKINKIYSVNNLHTFYY